LQAPRRETAQLVVERDSLRLAALVLQEMQEELATRRLQLAPVAVEAREGRGLMRRPPPLVQADLERRHR